LQYGGNGHGEQRHEDALHDQRQSEAAVVGTDRFQYRKVPSPFECGDVDDGRDDDEGDQPQEAADEVDGRDRVEERHEPVGGHFLGGHEPQPVGERGGRCRSEAGGDDGCAVGEGGLSVFQLGEHERYAGEHGGIRGRADDRCGASGEVDGVAHCATERFVDEELAGSGGVAAGRDGRLVAELGASDHRCSCAVERCEADEHRFHAVDRFDRAWRSGAG